MHMWELISKYKTAFASGQRALRAGRTQDAQRYAKEAVELSSRILKKGGTAKDLKNARKYLTGR